MASACFQVFEEMERALGPDAKLVPLKDLTAGKRLHPLFEFIRGALSPHVTSELCMLNPMPMPYVCYSGKRCF